MRRPDIPEAVINDTKASAPFLPCRLPPNYAAADSRFVRYVEAFHAFGTARGEGFQGRPVRLKPPRTLGAAP